MIAFSSTEGTLDLAFLGPIGRSARVSRCFHFATVSVNHAALGECCHVRLTVCIARRTAIHCGRAAAAVGLQLDDPKQPSSRSSALVLESGCGNLSPGGLHHANSMLRCWSDAEACVLLESSADCMASVHGAIGYLIALAAWAKIPLSTIVQKHRVLVFFSICAVVRLSFLSWTATEVPLSKANLRIPTRRRGFDQQRNGEATPGSLCTLQPCRCLQRAGGLFLLKEAND